MSPSDIPAVSERDQGGRQWPQGQGGKRVSHQELQEHHEIGRGRAAADCARDGEEHSTRAPQEDARDIVLLILEAIGALIG